MSKIESCVTYGVWGYDFVVGDDDRLYLTWVAGVYKEGVPQPFKALMFSRSDDAGRTWSKPIWINDLEEGQRIILAVSMPGLAKDIEIISEVTQKVSAMKKDEPHTYGVRWLNFTEKKLEAIEKGEAIPAPNKELGRPAKKTKVVKKVKKKNAANGDSIASKLGRIVPAKKAAPKKAAKKNFLGLN